MVLHSALDAVPAAGTNRTAGTTYGGRVRGAARARYPRRTVVLLKSRRSRSEVGTLCWHICCDEDDGRDTHCTTRKECAGFTSTHAVRCRRIAHSVLLPTSFYPHRLRSFCKRKSTSAPCPPTPPTTPGKPAEREPGHSGGQEAEVLRCISHLQAHHSTWRALTSDRHHAGCGHWLGIIAENADGARRWGERRGGKVFVVGIGGCSPARNVASTSSVSTACESVTEQQLRERAGLKR